MTDPSIRSDPGGEVEGDLEAGRRSVAQVVDPVLHLDLIPRLHHQRREAHRAHRQVGQIGGLHGQGVPRHGDVVPLVRLADLVGVVGDGAQPVGAGGGPVGDRELAASDRLVPRIQAGDGAEAEQEVGGGDGVVL